MRILIIEDDGFVAELIRRWLSDHYYSVDHAENATKGEDLAWSNDYDVIIMDVMLPDKSGKELVRLLREEGLTTPILMLTALGAPADVIDGLDRGADDYLAKPFDLDVLLARVRALARRESKERTAEIRIADLVINTAERTVTRGERKIELAWKAFALLEYLALNRGRIVNRDEIIEHMWDNNFDSQSNVINTLVYTLRSQIDKGFEMPLIHTIRGVGYYIDDKPKG